MKCFTVSEKGVSAGITLSSDPYPHVGVGDPNVSYDYRRVEVDEALAGSSANGTVSACSVSLEMKEDDSRRASYKLIAPKANDDAAALVKLEVRPGSGRTYYHLPRNTFTVAKGWFSRSGGPTVNTPVELIVLNQNKEIVVAMSSRLGDTPAPAFSLNFDGKELKLKKLA